MYTIYIINIHTIFREYTVPHMVMPLSEIFFLSFKMKVGQLANLFKTLCFLYECHVNFLMYSYSPAHFEEKCVLVYGHTTLNDPNLI